MGRKRRLKRKPKREGAPVRQAPSPKGRIVQKKPLRSESPQGSEAWKDGEAFPSVPLLIPIEGEWYDADEIGAWLFDEAIKSRQQGLDQTTHLTMVRRVILRRWPNATPSEQERIVSQAERAADVIFSAKQVVVL